MPVPHLPDGPVLGVWAHPDDEAYLSAGLMATAVDAGRRVVVATATWGERGTDDPAQWPPDRLAELRAAELTASLNAVGVEDHRHLGHRDGECDAADTAAVAAVRALIEEVGPAVVVTFGPDGMTGHPDHRAVSRWTTSAWEAAGRPGVLWYATVTPAFHARWGEVNERLGLWLADDRPCTPEDRLAHVVACTGRIGERKVAALDAHESQTAALRWLLTESAWRGWWSEECFVAAP